MIVNSGKYFLYRHVRLDTNLPFYIGIGTKRLKKPNCYTCVYERAFSKTQRSNFWKSVVNKTEYEVEILLESNDKKFILQKESEFINLYGRRFEKMGTLVNFKNEDSLIKGKPHTEESKRKLSIANRGQKRTEETKKLISKNLLGKKKSKEHVLKIKEALKGNKHCLGKKATPEKLKNMRGSHGKKVIELEKDKVVKIWTNMTEVAKSLNFSKTKMFEIIKKQKEINNKKYKYVE